MRQYTILLIPDPDEGSYVVDVPVLPGCHTQGDSIEEAIANAREAIAAWIKSAEMDGEPIPEELAPPQTITISIAA